MIKNPSVGCFRGAAAFSEFLEATRSPSHIDLRTRSANLRTRSVLGFADMLGCFRSAEADFFYFIEAAPFYPNLL